MGPGDRGATAPTSSTSGPRRWSRRIARMPLNQLQMMKLLVNQSLYAQGLHATQTARHGVRRHRPPHAGGLRVPGPGGPRGVPGRGPRPRRAVRRPRTARRSRAELGGHDHRHPRPAARRRPGADRGGRLRRRLGDRDRRARRSRGRHAVPPLRLQGGAVRRGVPLGVRARGARHAGGGGGDA